jgi:23S rRNA pseudouridine1911/1915/1917 synthase
MTSIGHPLVGDPTYGSGASRVPRVAEFPRQALHACRLSLLHPGTGKAMLWRSAVPEDMATLIDSVRLEAVAAQAGECISDEELDDWDDDGDGPEVIIVRGDGGADADDEDLGEQ